MMDIRRIAMVMAGPHDPSGFYDAYPHELLALREHKWSKMLTPQEQGEFISIACAVIRELGREAQTENTPGTDGQPKAA